MMKIPFVTKEKQEEIENRRYEEDLKYAHSQIFCDHCGVQKNQDCFNLDCPVGVYNTETLSVYNFTNDEKMALIRKAYKHTQVYYNKNKNEVSIYFNNGKTQVAGTTTEMSLDKLYESATQTGIFGTEHVWKNNKIVALERKPFNEESAVRSALIGNIDFDATTVFDNTKH